MDGLKDVLSFLGAVIGLISALIPLLGYMADKRRRPGSPAEARTDAPRPIREHPPGPAIAAEILEPVVHAPPVGRAAIERAEQLVRSPAIFMIVVGALALTINLATAGIGFIDEFVVPLGIKPARDNPMRGAPDGPFGDRPIEPGVPDSDRGTTVLGIIGILFFALASAIAIWSGYNMLRLRNYWLAVAGSTADPGQLHVLSPGAPLRNLVVDRATQTRSEGNVSVSRTLHPLNRHRPLHVHPSAITRNGPRNGVMMDRQAVNVVFRRNVAQHYFDMKGRVQRREFWHFVLACFVIYVVAFIFEAIVRRRVLTPVIGLVLLFPMAGLGARRLQDTVTNGMLVLAYSIPTVILEVVSLLGAYRPDGMSGSLNFIFRRMCLAWLATAIVFSYFWAQPGTAGPNEYGPDPKAPSAAIAA